MSKTDDNLLTGNLRKPALYLDVMHVASYDRCCNGRFFGPYAQCLPNFPKHPLNFNADIVFSIRDAPDDMVLPVGVDDYRDIF